GVKSVANLNDNSNTFGNTIYKMKRIANSCTHEGEWLAATCTTPKCCPTCGRTEGELDPSNHAQEPTWTYDEHKHTGVYGCCNTPIATDEAHKWADEETVYKEPTCTEKGLKSRVCTICGSPSNTIEIPALGHAFAEEFTVDKEPTCTKEGSKSKHCTREGCNECDEVTTIEPLGHDSSEWTIFKAPTCEKDGVEGKTCNRCWAEVETRAIPATGHTSETWIVEKEAEIEVDGKRYKICSVCGKKFDEEVIPALTLEDSTDDETKTGCKSAMELTGVVWGGTMILVASVMLFKKKKER
ncbi:MAG: hypothetical protein ACI3XQ_00420, partial [Eubacteriales bacterium]